MSDASQPRSALEVIVMWGESNVLDVVSLAPPRSFVIGDAVDKDGRGTTDFVIGAEMLGGREALPLVIVEDGQSFVLVTPSMEGTVHDGDVVKTIDEVRADGRLITHHDVPGTQRLLLDGTTHVDIALGELRFIVRAVDVVDALPIARSKFDVTSWGWVAGSLAFHAFFLALFYFLPPSAAARNTDILHIDRRYIDYVMQPPEPDLAEHPELPADTRDAASGEDGKAHKDDVGEMGKPDTARTRNRYAVQGDALKVDQALARAQAIDQARTAGIIGQLKQAMGSWDAPTSPYGRDQAMGSDAISAIGALMGDQVGANFGWGGLGPRGTGRGGGGDGDGTVGTGDLGTLGGMGGPGGHGSGPYGSTQGTLRGHESRVPKLTVGPTEVRGGLSKETIRREIRRHLSEIRFCYEQELTSRPDLSGRVAVKLIISPDGPVQSALVADSTLGNARVENCVRTAVLRWSFPAAPGLSIVSYPFVFDRATE